MLQAIVNQGKVLTEGVNSPVLEEGRVLVKVVNSCISAGTELMSIESSNKSLIRKVIEKPEKLIEAYEIIKSKGINRFVSRVSDAKSSLGVIGYSIAGIVIDVADDVENFQKGQYVAAAGVGYAMHAEIVSVPKNLVVSMQDGVDFKQASTVALGGIAMQGVRRANLKIGEYCVVMGVGLIGLLTLQMLKNSGVRVAAIDIDEERLNVAKDLGAELVINPTKEDAVNCVNNWTGSFGVDAAIFCAATNKSKPLSDAFRMTRRKGKVVLVGVSGMEIDRGDIYPKELDFLVSTSYGPGRYDNSYEEEGCDYPYSYVRWTENRNMQEYLRLLSKKLISLDKISERVFPIEEAGKAFSLLGSNNKKPLLLLLSYGKDEDNTLSFSKTDIKLPSANSKRDIVNIAFVGIGAFALGMHLPNIDSMPDKYKLYAIVNKNGVKAKEVGIKFNVAYITSDYSKVLQDEKVDLIFISTRHSNHAELVLSALEAGKNVFVEKPLATNMDDLLKIEKYFQKTKVPPLLMVGYNRRFSKYVQEINKHTNKRINPMVISYRMNAGYIPKEHWVHNDGGRIVGEACHIIDVMTFLTNSVIESISYESLSPTNTKYSKTDNKSIILKYRDGSICTIAYFSTGAKSFPKEYMEVHFDNKTIVLNDYKSLQGFGINNFESVNSKQSEKGHIEELLELYNFLVNSDKAISPPIEVWDMLQTTKAALLIK